MKINLLDVIEQCERGIYLQEHPFPLAEAEQRRLRENYGGNADIIVGDYAIRKIRDRDEPCSDCDELIAQLAYESDENLKAEAMKARTDQPTTTAKTRPPKEPDADKHARQLRGAIDACPPIVRRHIRHTDKYLKEITDAVTTALKALDNEMKGPSTADRGSRIAKISNFLEIRKDFAVRFGLRK